MPVTRPRHVDLDLAFLSPRMLGIYRANQTFQGLGMPAKDKIEQHGSSEEGSSADKTIIAHSLGSRTFGQGPNRQVVAASLLPAVEPHYAGLIAIVIVFMALIYFALYKFADFVSHAAGTIPLEGSEELTGEYQPPSQGAGIGSRPEDVQASRGVRMERAGTDELCDRKFECSNRRQRVLRDIQSRIKRTFRPN